MTAETLPPLPEQVARLRAFANDIMDCWPDGDVDGGYLQDMAERHGLLAPERRYEPCGEACTCAGTVEHADWVDGVTCYRRTALLNGAALSTPAAQEGDPFEGNVIVGHSQQRGGWFVYEQTAPGEYAPFKGPFSTREEADAAMREPAPPAAQEAETPKPPPYAAGKQADVVGYVARWGGNCRDCADENGVCPNSGLPCGGARNAIEHVIKALQYGVKHGYIDSPIADKASQEVRQEPVALTEEQFCASLPDEVARSYTPAELDIYEKGFRHSERAHGIKGE